MKNNMSYAVEMWRGIAALMVLWAHWGPELEWPMGVMSFSFTGVDIFFVLSGFIFAPAILAKEKIKIKAFAIRRITRIYPLYIIALLIYVLIKYFNGGDLLFIPEHIFMLHLQSTEMTFYYNPAFWSLPPEVSFYILIPILAILPQNKKIKILIFFFMASMALRINMLYLADRVEENFSFIILHHLPCLLMEFLIGTFAWRLYSMRCLFSYRYLIFFMGIVGWIVLAYIYLFIQDIYTAQHWKNGQLGVFAAICFSFSLVGSVYIMDNGLKNKKIIILSGWLGKLSFSIYLLHTAWLPFSIYAVGYFGVLIGSIIGVFLLIITCVFLSIFIEEPMRIYGRKLAQKHS